MYTCNNELYHFGVKGMKWGVRRYQNRDGSLTDAGKKRDRRLGEKVKTLSNLSTQYSREAKEMAEYLNNGSRSLEKSDRYLKKANKLANKMTDSGKSITSTKTYKKAVKFNQEAGEKYVKRRMNERVGTFAKNAAISAGASFVGFYAGMPVGVLYLSSGPKYDLKHSDFINELYHGGKKEKHKYIAKVKMKNGKFRYFYDKKEYQDYLKGKRNDNSLNKLEKSFSDIVKKVDRFIDKLDKKNKKTKKNKNKNIGFSLFLSEKHVFKGIDWVKRKLRGDNKKRTDEKKHKYVKKITMANGKTRYFYSEDEYLAYTKRQEYQKNEPEFMKKVSKINANTHMDAEDDMAEINEAYNPRDLSHSMNCMSCTTAYELRRRGYNVEAASDTDGEPITSLNDWYKNPKAAMYTKGMFDSGVDIEDAIKKTSPKNSRGNLMVTWEGGGGHSVVYEVDSKGDVKIRDCQINKVIDSTDLVVNIRNAAIVRTDNLELQEGVLDKVVNN